MIKHKYIFFYIITGLILFGGYSHAHNPRIIRNTQNNKDQPIVIINPEISQAFYGELRGRPDFFKINSSTEFNLYLSLTVPNISGSDLDYGFIIKDNGENIIGTSDINDFKGEIFYEKFAGDEYNQGPEFEKKLNSGSYYIQIYSPDNKGKYVLAIGKGEERPLYEIGNTLKALPSLKSYFFNKPLITVFFNYIGLSVLVLIILIASTIIVIYRLYKKFKS